MKSIKEIGICDGLDYIKTDFLIGFPKLNFSRMTVRSFKKILKSWAIRNSVFGRLFFCVWRDDGSRKVYFLDV